MVKKVGMDGVAVRYCPSCGTDWERVGEMRGCHKVILCQGCKRWYSLRVNEIIVDEISREEGREGMFHIGG